MNRAANRTSRENNYELIGASGPCFFLHTHIACTHLKTNHTAEMRRQKTAFCSAEHGRFQKYTSTTDQSRCRAILGKADPNASGAYVIETDGLDGRTELAEGYWTDCGGINQFVSCRRRRGYKRHRFAFARQRNLDNGSTAWTAANLKCRSDCRGSLTHSKDSKVI